jgi:hypothetical protein
MALRWGPGKVCVTESEIGAEAGQGATGAGAIPGVPARLPTVLVVIGGVLALGTIAVFSNAFVDDAYISLRYVQHALAGDGLVFNPGERVEGFTNLGHVLLIALLGRLGLDLEIAARALGLLGMGIATWLGPAAILPGPGLRLERGLARMLLLANFPFVFFAWTGLETGSFCGAVAAAAFVFARAEGRLNAAVGLLLGAAFAIRPDGLLFAGALALLAWRRNGFAPVLRMSGGWIFLVVVLAVEIFRWSYFGALVPNTALVKGAAALKSLADVPWFGTFGDDAVELLAQTGGAFGVIAALAAIVLRRDRGRVELAVAVILAAATFEIYAGGDWMLGYRFLQPALPFYLSLVALGLVAGLRALARHARGPTLGIAFAVGCIIVAVNCFAYGLAFRAESGRYPHYHMTSRLMVDAAHALADRYPPGTRIAAPYIGALGYFTDLHVIDTIGLTDAEIARAGSDTAEREAILTRRAPQVVLKIERPGPGLTPERELHGATYRFIEALPMSRARPWLVYERLESDVDGGPR